MGTCPVGRHCGSRRSLRQIGRSPRHVQYRLLSETQCRERLPRPPRRGGRAREQCQVRRREGRTGRCRGRQTPRRTRQRNRRRLQRRAIASRPRQTERRHGGETGRSRSRRQPHHQSANVIKSTRKAEKRVKELEGTLEDERKAAQSSVASVELTTNKMKLLRVQLEDADAQI